MSNIGHPQAPNETNAGKDSVHADEVAAQQEEALQQEELNTDE